MEKRLIYNAIRTPDGTILQSKHRHDFNSYTDANGQFYAVDGGLEYSRRSFDIRDFEDLSLYTTDVPQEKWAKYLVWGKNYDKDMNRLPETIWTPIREMDVDHICAILDGGYCKDEFYKNVFKLELLYRGYSQGSVI